MDYSEAWIMERRWQLTIQHVQLELIQEADSISNMTMESTSPTAITAVDMAYGVQEIDPGYISVPN